MKKKSLSFFESDEKVEPGHKQKVGVAVSSILARARELSARARPALWLVAGLSTAAAIVAVIVIYKTSVPIEPHVVAPPIAQLPPVAAPPVEEPKPVAKVARVTPKVPPRVDIEMVKEVEILGVLHILKNLDVLTKWSGTNTAQLLPLLLEFLAGEKAFAADDIPIDQNFLRDMLSRFPEMSVNEQKEMLRSFRKLVAAWPENGPQIVANYEVWKKGSQTEKQVYRERLKTWNALSPKTQADVRQKYQRWVKLSSEEQKQIRRRLKI